jgi:hypothetical protein
LLLFGGRSLLHSSSTTIVKPISTPHKPSTIFKPTLSMERYATYASFARTLQPEPANTYYTADTSKLTITQYSWATSSLSPPLEASHIYPLPSTPRLNQPFIGAVVPSTPAFVHYPTFSCASQTHSMQQTPVLQTAANTPKSLWSPQSRVFL